MIPISRLKLLQKSILCIVNVRTTIITNFQNNMDTYIFWLMVSSSVREAHHLKLLSHFWRLFNWRIRNWWKYVKTFYLQWVYCATWPAVARAGEAHVTFTAFPFSFPCDAHIPHLSSLVRQSDLCSRPVHTWIKLRSVYFCLQCLQNAYVRLRKLKLRLRDKRFANHKAPCTTFWQQPLQSVLALRGCSATDLINLIHYNK